MESELEGDKEAVEELFQEASPQILCIRLVNSSPSSSLSIGD